MSERELSKVAAFERVQTGVRMEKRMVKVLKGLSEYLGVSLGDLLEAIVLHAFENEPPFKTETLDCITKLREVYGMNYGIESCHKFPQEIDTL